MDLKRWSLPIRILIAVVVGFGMLAFIYSGVPKGQELSPADKVVGLILSIMYGFILFALFGWSMILRVGDRFASLYTGRDEDIQIVPEYSVAEARAAMGKYQEAIDEYRKVIAEYPEDIYPHLRIAEMAVKHLNDLKLAELELLLALGKAKGEDTTALAAGRLADFYQLTLNDPARALEVMKQVREKIPGTKQAKLAEERITVLEGVVHAGVSLPKSPEKIASRPSRFKLSE
jgi:tetratricopeptide (TPR) repeat protein